MRLATLRLTANLVFASSLIVSGRAEPQEGVPPPAPAPSFWQAASGVAAVNGLTWFYNWRVQRWDWANVGTRSWWANLRDGFTWDDDVFGANQAAHPYHGSLYFNAARASGYDFWGSAPYVAAGSLSWELFTENVRPSLNDLITTTLGGIALGEVSYRMSSLLSSRGTAASRQLAAFVLSPIARAQSLVHGSSRASSIEGPESSSALLAVGQRRGAGASPAGSTGNRPFVGFTFHYGSAFDEQVRRPYDAFEFRLHLSPDDQVVLTHVSVSGLIARHHLSRASRNQLLLGLFQHYDYDDVPLAKASSQSLSGALLYRRPGARTQMDLGFHVEVAPLGTVSSDHNLVRRRDYDFGVGLGSRFTGVLRHDGRDLLRLDARSIWIHSMYSADANHLMTTARLSAAIPVIRMVSVGGDVGLTFRQSTYRSQPRVTKRIPQVRAYLTWSPS
jgi:hypothetical protein